METFIQLHPAVQITLIVAIAALIAWALHVAER
jgi:hypothetical protein